MPAYAVRNINEFRRLNPGWTVEVHGEDVLHPEYRAAFEATPELCSKADLLRYSVMERLGGWYFDCDYWPFRALADAERAWCLDGSTVFIAECWPVPKKPGWLGNGLIASAPGHPIWERVRSMVKRADLSRVDRLTFGPSLFKELYLAEPASFTLAAEPWFNGIKAPMSTKVYRHVTRTGNSALARRVLDKTGGQLPFAMHLWAWRHGAALDARVPSLAARSFGNGARTACVVALPGGKAGDGGSVFTSTAKGIAACGYTAEITTYEARAIDLCGDIPEVVVVWNGNRTPGDRIVEQAERMGIRTLRMEYGFMDRANYFQLDHEGILHRASWRRAVRGPAPECGAERLRRFYPNGLVPMSARQGGYILVLGQVPGDTQVEDSEIQGPVPLQGHIINALPAGTPVFFRPHPAVSAAKPNPAHRLLPTLGDAPVDRENYKRLMQSSDGSLANALAGAAFVITINSNALVEALAAGVPSLAFGPHLGIDAEVIHPTTLATLAADIREMQSGWIPSQERVENFLRWLAARQWTRDELATPEVMAPLLRAAGAFVSDGGRCLGSLPGPSPLTVGCNPEEKEGAQCLVLNAKAEA